MALSEYSKKLEYKGFNFNIKVDTQYPLYADEKGKERIEGFYIVINHMGPSNFYENKVVNDVKNLGSEILAIQALAMKWVDAQLNQGKTTAQVILDSLGFTNE